MTSDAVETIRVLVVEDNFVVADALRYLIDGYGGFETTTAPTLERAFAVLHEGAVDAAVLDINLNGISVVPFAEHLHATGVPFVFLTGYDDDELLPEPLRAYPRFRKPVDADPFIDSLRGVAARRGVGRPDAGPGATRTATGHPGLPTTRNVSY